MKSLTDPPWYASSALNVSDYVMDAIGRLGKRIALDIAREENRDTVTEEDIEKGIERAVGEIYEEIRNPMNEGTKLLDLINSMVGRHAA